MRHAFRLVMGFGQRGEIAQAGGWFARASGLVEEIGPDCVERGYLLVPQALRALDSGDPEEVRGGSPTVPGLYFLGVPFSYAFSSMLVAGARRDAKYVVDRIAERVGARADTAVMTPAAAR